jgi:hypothetical protein
MSTSTATPTPTPSATATPTPVPAAVLYFSLSATGTVGGLSFANEDIIAWNGSSFSLYFDGGDVGLATFNIDAFAVLGDNQVLMSFTASGTVPGIGTVDDSDVVRFSATSLGENTAGSFAMYFDGSDVGLTTNSEDVDAVELLANGDLLFSTLDSMSAGGVSAADEDLVRFIPTSLGATTSGTWVMYFDGSDVGLATNNSEDVDAVAIGQAGELYLSSTGAFSVTGVSGADEDVFVFTPASLGTATAGSFSGVLFFDGSTFALGSNDIIAIDLP